MDISTSEKLMFSTVRIECVLSDNTISTGTGFYYNFLDNDKGAIIVIITNKHVIKGAVKGTIHVALSDDGNTPVIGKYHTVDFNDFENKWFPHPDENVDLCMFFFVPVIKHLQEQGLKAYVTPFYKGATLYGEQFSELESIEDIIMIGYPNGIWDSVNNLPIIRKGITATHPKVNYNGKEEFMIDAACFPGSSGSPVIIYNSGTIIDKQGKAMVGNRVKLIGVLYAGPQYTATGDIEIINVPTKQQAVVFSRIPNNLGLVIRSDKILEFESMFKYLFEDLFKS